MKLPVTYKPFLRMLIQIAEHGNDYYDQKLPEADQHKVGHCIAEIQNWLGENRGILDRYNLTYNS